jgi:hypothetical protein
MNRKMFAMTVTPVGRFMTMAAYSHVGAFSIVPMKLALLQFCPKCRKQAITLKTVNQA